MSELHPCEYCGTMLAENGEVESNIAACGPRMQHYASQCVIYVHAALQSYKAETVKLRAVVDAARILRANVGRTTGPMWSALDRAFDAMDGK